MGEAQPDAEAEAPVAAPVAAAGPPMGAPDEDNDADSDDDLPMTELAAKGKKAQLRQHSIYLNLILYPDLSLSLSLSPCINLSA